MKAASLWMTRAIFAAALIAFSTLPTSAFADRDDDAKSARKDHHTIGSAWFSKEEDVLGSIEVGKLADLAVLSDDYLSVPEARIPTIKSVLTLHGGRVVHGELD